ncbi:MAG: DivIVA domain-containing protein [Ignavibacteria bacterium]|nr:DivIVA domain-containing protein [Ignavibacteria bacterium]
MSLTRLEIQQQQFKKVLRGYDIREVGSYLAQLASEIESLQTENASLKTSLNEAVKELERYHQLEQTIQQTLVQAQESSNKFLSNAKLYEEQSRREAEAQAAVIIEEAHKEKIKLSEEISILEMKQKNIVENLKQFLSTELEIVNKAESSLPRDVLDADAMEEKRKRDAEIEEIVKVLVG